MYSVSGGYNLSVCQFSAASVSMCARSRKSLIFAEVCMILFVIFEELYEKMTETLRGSTLVVWRAVVLFCLTCIFMRAFGQKETSLFPLTVTWPGLEDKIFN